MNQKYRVFGISRQSGKLRYLSWRKYKDSIFFYKVQSPTTFCEVNPHDFINIQLEAQRLFKNVKWEVCKVKPSAVLRRNYKTVVDENFDWNQVPNLSKSN